jgi:hypothetical protein
MASQLRYMGFNQAKNIREYKFDGVSQDETTTHFVVNADLALFFRYHVALQEGPVLCLKKLSADLEAPQQPPHELTGGDLAAHVSAQAAAAANRITKRKRRRTGRPEYCIYPATSGI